MIKHIVMWRLKESAGGRSRDENALEIKKRLEALRDAVPGIRELEVGLNVKEAEAAADLVLVTAFDDAAALEAYQRHPAHQEVVAFVRTVVSERRVVDYEA